MRVFVSSGQPKYDIAGAHGKPGTDMIDQAYFVTYSLLEEMLNFVNSSFFRFLDFLYVHLHTQIDTYMPTLYPYIIIYTSSYLHGPVGWSGRIHQLNICRGIRLPQEVSWTLNNLMVRLQKCWSFEECEVPLL